MSRRAITLFVAALAALLIFQTAFGLILHLVSETNWEKRLDHPAALLLQYYTTVSAAQGKLLARMEEPAATSPEGDMEKIVRLCEEARAIHDRMAFLKTASLLAPVEEIEKRLERLRGRKEHAGDRETVAVLCAFIDRETVKIIKDGATSNEDYEGPGLREDLLVYMGVELDHDGWIRVAEAAAANKVRLIGKDKKFFDGMHDTEMNFIWKGNYMFVHSVSMAADDEIAVVDFEKHYYPDHAFVRSKAVLKNDHRWSVVE